jgi:LmbE family N-acetylglucosaminyl deacetylase
MQLQNILSIHRQYDHVYVSPHFDDVAASCSGRIFKQLDQGESVLIVTVFTAAATHGSTTFSNTLKSILNYKRRRQEDSTAMQRMDVDYLWLEHPEFLFRNQRPWARYWPHYRATPSNKILCDTLTRELHEICIRTDCANLILPLGVGQHMDHQILFQAGLTLLHGKDRICRIIFYEETPYALFPFLLTYRLKKTGIKCMFLCGQHRQPDSTRQLSAKEIFRLGSSIPSLGIHWTIIKPWVFILILGFHFYTRCLMKPSSGFFDDHPPFPKVCDITPFIDRKLFVISAYTSQLTGPMVDEQRIKTGLSAYASTLGIPRGGFGERYWTTPDPNV